MRRRILTGEEAYEIEIRHLKEAAARFGGLQERDRERRRAAARSARERAGAGEGHVSNYN